MTDDSAPYVTNSAWLRPAARSDAVDEIADQFERPSAVPAPELIAGSSGEQFEPAVRWPRSSRGWRSMGRLHPRSSERLAS